MAGFTIERQLGERIRRLRRARGMTQPELGARIGRVFQQVQKYEHGHSSLSPSMLYAIADALDVPAGELLTGIDNGPLTDLRPIEAEILHAVRALPSDEIRRAFLLAIQAAAEPPSRRRRRKAPREI